MRSIILGTMLLTLATGPAFAGGHDPAPPPPAAPTNIQGQGQGQAQGQAQGQLQGQGQQQGQKLVNRNNLTAGGGAGGTGIGGGGGAGGTGNGGSANQGQELNNSGAGSNSNNYNQSGIPASSATAPSFAIGGCQWAVSGGAQFFGFGASGGTAGMYEFCKGMMKAKHFREVGREDMAKLMECGYADMRQAYADAGTPCRADVPKDQLASTPIVQPVGWVAPTPAATAGAQVGATPLTAANLPPPGWSCVDKNGQPAEMGKPGAVRCL